MKTGLCRSLVVLACGVAFAGKTGASGYYGPGTYLDQGGKNVAASPEFNWELEVKRLAGRFHPAEKLRSSGSFDDSGGAVFKSESTRQADLQDFAAALAAGAIRPADPLLATQQQEAARQFVATASAETTPPLPSECDSEFADYHAGALAYRLGPDHWQEARAAWEKLLQRPAAERPYRTTWATFMLGKIAMKKGDFATAAAFFQQTRQLAADGFADSLGLAADSYGWEGRCEWKQNHPEKAAPLFLTQLALGDESAIISLKTLVPDRTPVEGMLNYGPEPADRGAWTDQQKAEASTRERQGLAAAAADPLLREIVTAHILATETNPAYATSSEPPAARGDRWLAAIRDAKIAQVENAEYLGWVAYHAGHYPDAARWLEMADPNAPAACWLQAKLHWREGKLDQAAASMEEAWQTLRQEGRYTGWKSGAGDQAGGSSRFQSEQESWHFPVAAGGDFGAMHLQRGDFLQALDIFLQADLWSDAAYLAERVLTADELLAFVEKQPATPAPPPGDDSHDLRYLLGRRLVREDRYKEAARFLPAPYDQVLGRYVAALRRGADKDLPKIARARAWFTAAWLARHSGMEIMGTEEAPDGHASGGAFEETDLSAQRLAGEYPSYQYENGDSASKNLPLVLLASRQEKQRLLQHKVEPELRYHYRSIAAALAIRAAALLGDETEELADVVNTAGLWTRDREEKTADRYYQILEKRAAGTNIGRAAVARHWFVDQPGPWTLEQQAAYDQMSHDLGLNAER